MRRAAVLLALALAFPASAQGWGKAAEGWGKISAGPGGTYATMPAPSGCASGLVPYFNSSLKLVCSPTVYAPSTDTTTAGSLVAKNLTASGLATPGAITVTPVLSKIGAITVVAGSLLADGDGLVVGDGTGTVPIEFDASPGDGTTGGAVPIIFDGTETATEIRDAVKAILDGAGRDWTTSAQGADGIGLVRATPGATGGGIAEDVTNAGFLVTDWTDPTHATTYTYRLVWRLPDGTTTEGGAASTTAAGVATLTTANRNDLTWAAGPAGTVTDVYRTVGGATTGKIATGITATTLSDTGLAGGGETAPTVDGTGRITSDALTPGGVAIVGAGGRVETDAGLTYDAGADKAKLGSAASSGDDAALLLARAATNPLATGGSHGVRDEDTYASGEAGGYASFDSAPAMAGAGAHSHLHSFQSRPYFNGTNGIGAVRGSTFQLYGTWSGAIGQVSGMYVADSAGTGTITTQAGLYVDELTKGESNYAVYTAGATPSYFNGAIIGNSTIAAAGLVTGSNLKSNADAHTVRVGVSAGALGYFNTYIGHLAANASNDSDQKNVCVGTRSGNAIAAGSSNVFVGYNSGYYETGSSKLMIDDRPRTDEADARLKALLYGVFADATADQVLTVNAAKVRLPYLPTYADNAAALAGSLVAGDVYRTSTGVLMVTYTP